jgi:NADH dehydrogenase
VTNIDPVAKTVTTETGETYSADYIVLAAGSQPNFFKTPGAEHAFPLYSLDDADRLRARIVQAFEEADRDPDRVDEGAIDFVIVGGGPTGVEVAGALSEMINTTMVHEFPALAPRARVHIVNHGDALLAMFADKGHAYTARVLEKDNVELLLGKGVTEIGPGHVTLSDGSTIKTRCVVWGGGLMAAPVASASGLPQGKGGRIDVGPDFTDRRLSGDARDRRHREHPEKDGKTYPQLGSVALQSGGAAAKTILADRQGHEPKPFSYLDKGTMAMIGRGAAIAQVKGVELHGKLAFAAWLGVHAALMTGGSNRVDAFKSWAEDFFGSERAPRALDRSGTPRMQWEDDDIATAAAATTGGGG